MCIRDRDQAGSVYTTGWFAETADFDPGSAVFSLTAGDQTGAFISKLDSQGQFVWAVQIGGAAHTGGAAIGGEDKGQGRATPAAEGRARPSPYRPPRGEEEWLGRPLEPVPPRQVPAIPPP